MFSVSHVAAQPAQNDFAAVRAAYRPSDVRLLDRHGDPLQERRIDKSVRRFEWVGLNEVSPALIDAVIAAEDRRFYEHRGIDLKALLAAAREWLGGAARRGGSTITMQLAGMLDPSLLSRAGRRSLAQKWRQIWAARRLETMWSKEQILEAYLNLASFRGEIQGVGAAAAVLFGKLPHGIDHAEGCALAALLKGPNASQEILWQRARGLCADLDESDPRPKTDSAQAKHLRLRFDSLVAEAARRAASVRTNLAGAQLAPQLARRLLPEGHDAHTLRSSIDGRLQRVAIDSLRQNLLALRERNVGDGAVLVADNASGEVLAYVGGAGDLSSAKQVDGVQARRQAGSTLKPFLYGLAVEQRLLTAASLIDDSPLEIRVANGLYRPQSYDGLYRGLVSVRTALAGSLNVPAVRTLELVGEDTFAQRLRQLGFRGLSEAGDYYGPSLALGSADVTLWELVNAYRSLANGGRWSALQLEVSDTRTRTEPTAARPVSSAAASFVIADILADRDSRATTFGTESALATRYWAAVKTGTSKEMRDNWCIGFSRRFTVGVWVGNLNGEPMHDVSGVAGAAPVWREVMDWLHNDETDSAPPPPAGLATATMAYHRREWFIDGTQPTQIAPSSRPARIVSPVSGAMIALDPDIPTATQRIVLQAQGERAALRWQVDGADLGAAIPPAVWKPVPGAHTVSLIDAGGTVVDTAMINVRGSL